MTHVERRTKAFLVEDDPNIVDLIRSNLIVRGYDTCSCAEGSRALEVFETEAPDIVLLDLMLPDADGFELCREIRERSSVGIIVVSAQGGQNDKVAALNYGADDYITKPFGIEELLRPDHRDASPFPPGRAHQRFAVADPSRRSWSSTWSDVLSPERGRRCTSPRPSSPFCGSLR